MGTEPPRKTDTRQALIDAALEVFLRHGFARATTREIAQTAGVAEGTIYRHFADKHALFHEVFLSLTVEVVAELQRFRERAGQGTIRDNLEALFALVGGIQEQLSSLMASMWADPELAKHIGARAREMAPRASFRRVRWRLSPSTSSRSRSWAGSGATSTRRRPRRSWSQYRSRPGWSARSARIPSRPASSPCRMTSPSRRPAPSTSWRADWPGSLRLVHRSSGPAGRPD